jgi:hypothetical protein
LFIDAVVKRIENGYAVLVSDDCGVEVSIPVRECEGMYMKGENVSLIIDNGGSINSIADKETKKRNPTNEE